MRQCCQLPVFNNVWSKTLGSNRCLWKQAAYGKKKKRKLGCCYAGSHSERLSLFSHTFSLHPSLSLRLPSLPVESEFSHTPRLNFLAALGGCQSRPRLTCSEALPPQLGQWLSHKPSAPSLPFCQANDFSRQLASELTGSWLCVFPPLHSNLSSPQKMALSLLPRKDFSLCCLSDGKSKPSALNTKSVNYTILTRLLGYNAVRIFLWQNNVARMWSLKYFLLHLVKICPLLDL